MAQLRGEKGDFRDRPSSGKEPSLHQLRLFLVLAEELHFGRAAARLFMTQPAFSQQIRALEERLGVLLVERTSRSVGLTEAGRALAPEARDVLDAMAHLRRRADIHAREVRGQLTVGFIGGEAAMPYTHAILEELHARHPRVAIEMRGLTFVDQVEAVSCGDVDAAFLRPPLPAGLELLHLATEPRVACLPSGDRLATGAAITLDRLSGYAAVDFPPQNPSEWWDYWALNPRPDGTLVQRGPAARDIEALLHIVARGQAMCFLPAAARHLYPRQGIAFVDVTDAPASTAALAWHRRNRDNPLIQALRAAARATLA